jgi:spore germination cell wall hydrolase CwlJ-like protein
MTVRVRTAIIAVASFCLGVMVTSVPSFAVSLSAEPAIHPTTGMDEASGYQPDLSASLRSIQIPAIEGASTQAGPAADAGDGQTLAQLVDAREATDTLDREHECLAGAVYFESKGEPLEGQLAVAEVIMNRAASGRFPPSLCSVVFQRGQFSFVRRGDMPPIPRSSRAWQEAVAVSRIARDGLWKDVVPNAMYFHAARVSTDWGKQRVARLGHHVFYR